MQELNRNSDPLNFRRRRVVINISGQRFETFEDTLSRYPETLLGSPSKRLEYFDARREEYFFNRNRQAFDAILFYYQSSGRLVKPDLVPENVFLDELQFFQIQSEALSERERLRVALTNKQEVLPENGIQRTVWLIFSRPESSLAARAVSLFTIILIVASIIISCVESYVETLDHTVENMPLIFITLETTCHIWFSIELVIRLVASPAKITFLRRPLNIIDFVSVAPFYVVLVFKGTHAQSTLLPLRTARMLRVLRIFKLSRYSTGMRIFIYTFSSSVRELIMILMFILVSVLVSSSAAFYADYGEGKGAFSSIPGAFWWSINTITTLGYGDEYPYTTSGKFVGCVLAIFGVLVVALPVFLFVAKFKRVLSLCWAVHRHEWHYVGATLRPSRNYGHAYYGHFPRPFGPNPQSFSYLKTPLIQPPKLRTLCLNKVVCDISSLSPLPLPLPGLHYGPISNEMGSAPNSSYSCYLAGRRLSGLGDQY